VPNRVTSAPSFPYPNNGSSGAASYTNTYRSGLSRPTLKQSIITRQLCAPRDIEDQHWFSRPVGEVISDIGEIIKCAWLYDGNNPGETFNNFYLGDMNWASTISAEFSLNDGWREVVKPLVELLKRGIFDRESREPRSDIEERAMRYSAVCDNHILNYVVELHQKVGLLRDPCCDNADMSSSGVRSQPSVMPWSWL